MKKWLKRALLVVVVLLVVAAAGLCVVYASRFQTLATMQKLTAYDDGFNIYQMEVKYDYSPEDVIAYGITDQQSAVDAILKEALPLLPISMEAPEFGCTAFQMTDVDGDVHMGRNYDLRNATSAMLVYCAPENGYRSVGVAALDNVGANAPDRSLIQRMATLTAPFICLDGMNEMGVSIAVLSLNSPPVNHQTEKPNIMTTLAVRLVLDHAATTEEAVTLLESYDMFAMGGWDYHFYITDASGDARVVEYDCDNPARPLVATKTDVVSNFFIMYQDRVPMDRDDDLYGFGLDRYEAVSAVLSTAREKNVGTVWKAMRAVAKNPKVLRDVSTTQWSIDYNNTQRTMEIVLRCDWNNRIQYSLPEADSGS